MARRRPLDWIVLVALAGGALIFVLLLAGVGSSLFTNPPA